MAFAAGAFAGNFYHLIIHRVAGGGFRVVLPPSCPACGRAERRVWMLPILWYLILRGRCPRCGFAYARRILWQEVAGGAVAALLFYYYGPTLAFFTTFAFCFLFFLNFIVEFRYAALVPQLYVPAAGAGLALSFLPGPPSPVSAAAGGLLGGGLLLLGRLFAPRTAAPEGPAHRQLALVALAGVFLGWQSTVLILATAAAAAWALPKIGRRIVGRDADNCFGLGVLVAVLALAFFHRDITAWYFRIR